MTTETAKKEDQKAVLIPESLHAKLKKMAEEKGMKLGALAERKLQELVEPEQLPLPDLQTH